MSTNIHAGGYKDSNSGMSRGRGAIKQSYIVAHIERHDNALNEVLLINYFL